MYFDRFCIRYLEMFKMKNKITSNYAILTYNNLKQFQQRIVISRGYLKLFTVS